MSIKTKIYYIFIGLKSRLRAFQYGFIYLKGKNLKLPAKFLICKKFIELRFNQYSNDLFLDEFFSICLQDSYRIRNLNKKYVKTVLDIGANQVLFVLAARKVFPRAIIHAYEPNDILEGYITHNCHVLSTYFFNEAVMAKNCKVTLNIGSSDLATQALSNKEGDIEGISLNNSIHWCPV